VDGLYGLANLYNQRLHLCRFPCDITTGQRELARLRQIDPPFDSNVVPANPIESIAPDDLVTAYHFLLRATFTLMSDQITLTVPYLAAFHVLSNVRFAFIELAPDITDIGFNMTVINETNFKAVLQMLSALVISQYTRH
jgi:hypothetical protein